MVMVNGEPDLEANSGSKRYSASTCCSHTNGSCADTADPTAQSCGRDRYLLKL